MNIPYPIIQIPERKYRKDKFGNMINDARQYKKMYCNTFGITGARFHKIRKLQRRILRHVDIST